jgi:hypothetical protein
LVVRESCQVAIDMWEVRSFLSPSSLSSSRLLLDLRLPTPLDLSLRSLLANV